MSLARSRELLEESQRFLADVEYTLAAARRALVALSGEESA